jgi:mRNA-degrading endonuclease RelE of RelBE toxin-antitoxin system
MKDRINYCETPEFQKDFKKLLKKFKTLEDDFELAKKAAIELFHLQKINNLSVFPIPGFSKEPIQIMKLKKFACKSLAGRGAKSGIRIIYAFNSESFQVEFIEIYFKGENENEDRDRIKTYLKGGS